MRLPRSFNGAIIIYFVNTLSVSVEPVKPVDNVSAETAAPLCRPATLRQPHTDALMMIAEASLKASSASLSGGERQQTRCAPSPQTDNPLIP